MALGVNILSSFDSRGIEKAIKEFQKLETSGEKAQFAIKEATLPAAAALAGLAAAAGFSIQKSIESQAEQNRLRQILLTTGAATEEQVTALIAQADALELVGVASAGSIITAQSQLATFDLQFETIQKLTPAVVDYVIAEKGATATAEDFKTATNGLALALQGQFGSLTKTGFKLDEQTKSMIKNGTESERAAALVKVLDSTYKGFNETARDTAEGQMVALQNSFNRLRTNIGDALLPIFVTMTAALGTFADFAAENTTVVVALGTFIGVLATSILAASAALKIFNIVTALAAIKLKVFGIALTATGIGAIVVAVGLLAAGFMVLVQKTGGVTNAFKAMGNFIIGIFENIANKYVFMVNKIIDGLNLLSSPLRAIGINIGEIGPMAEFNFGRFELAAKGATDGAEETKDEVARLTTALILFQKATTAEGEARLASKDALTKWNKEAKEAFERTGSGSSAVKTAREQLSDYTAALTGNYDAQRQVTSATNTRISAEESLSKAVQSTRKAQEFFNNVVKGFSRDSKEAVGASKRFEDSQKRLRNANISQRDAVLDLMDAEKELQRLREITADPESVADAERKLERSKFDVEEANFAVIDAEQRLAELRKDPSSSAIAIRRAEISLAEAKLAVIDSVNGVKDAETSLSNEINRAATADEIADAERNLERAKLSVEDATDAVRDATMEQAVAQSLLNEILFGATEGSDAYTEAIEALNKAKDDEKRAREGVAGAILGEAQAMLALREAIIKLNQVSKVTPQGVVSRGQSQTAGLSTSNPALAALNQINRGQNNAAPIAVTVNAGMGTDGASVGKEIVDVLAQYQRANGYLPLITQQVAF
jgi:hypothetical protein